MNGPVTITVEYKGFKRSMHFSEATIDIKNEIIDTTKPEDLWKTYTKGPGCTVTITGKRSE